MCSRTPARIVQVFRKHYTNMKSLSVMLSRMKKDLKELDHPPPESYLEKIALKRSEYSELKKQAKDTRQKGALDVQIVSNADDVVLQALRYLTSSDPNLLYAALLPLTGLRPIEIAKQAQFSEKLNNTQNNAEFWACQTRFAKRGNMKSKYNHCRDRPFLAPYYLVERALNIIRQRWSCKHLTNVQVNRKFSTNLAKDPSQGLSDVARNHCQNVQKILRSRCVSLFWRLSLALTKEQLNLHR